MKLTTHTVKLEWLGRPGQPVQLAVPPQDIDLGHRVIRAAGDAHVYVHDGSSPGPHQSRPGN